MFIMEQKSIFIDKLWKVFCVFVENPMKIHFVKQISREISLAPTSVKLYIKKLEDNGIINQKKGDRFKGYIANRESENFIFYKKIVNLINIRESGVVDYIVREVYPRAVILYGSFLRGEDVEESDIDIFVLSEKRVNLKFGEYEMKLKRKIHIIMEDEMKKLGRRLRVDIMNGLVLYGYLQ